MTTIDDALEADSLQALMDVVTEEGSHQSLKTSVQRTEEIAKAITDGNLDELINLQSKMGTAVLRITENVLDMENLSTLSQDQLRSLMEELLDQKDIGRLLAVRYEMIRLAVFAHITEVHKQAEVHSPEWAPGEAEVPSLGKRFVREGGKVKPVLDYDKLRAKLGEEKWAQVCTTTVIPEHVETKVEDASLFALVRKDPSAMEILRECLAPGGHTPQRFTVKPLKKS